MAHQSCDREFFKELLCRGGNFVEKIDNASHLAKVIVLCPEYLPEYLKLKPGTLNVNEDGDSALMWALKCREICNTPRSERVLELIIDYLLDSSDQDYKSYYEFCKAIITNDMESVKSQLSEIKDVNFSHINSENPLAFAVMSNQFGMAKFLMKSGLSPESDENLNRQSLLFTCIYPNFRRSCYKMLELLLKFKAKPHQPILYDACMAKQWGHVRLLTKYSADVNCFGESDKTPFHIACQYADIETLKLMVEHRANLLTRDKSGRSILHFAAQNRRPGSFSYIANLVINQGLINVNEKDANGHTPLHLARNCCNNFFLLLKMGAAFDTDLMNVRSVAHSHDVGIIYCSVSDYLQRLKLLGYYTNRAKRALGIMHPTFLNLCVQELNKLREVVISWNPRVTMYSILFMKRNEMARFSGNENLIEIFDECNEDFETRYPHFGSVLNVQYRRGLQRRDLLESGKMSLAQILGTRVSENPAELILKYMDNSELESFGHMTWDFS